MTTPYVCPRAVENGHGPGSPFHRNHETKIEGGVCGYCGSIIGDVFMEWLEAGAVELDPTDKNYKVYVRHDDPRAGTKRLVSWANHRPEGQGWVELTKDNFDQLCEGMSEKDRQDAARYGVGHWVMFDTYGPKTQSKFYFQHLSEWQKKRFVELLNGNKIRLGYPGYFYKLPYFITQKPETAPA